MATNSFDSGFWNDPYVQGDEDQGGNNRGLDITERYLYVFLHTNPLANIAGVYQIPLKILTTYSGLEKNALQVILKRFERDGKVLYREDWIVIKDRTMINKQDNPSIREGVKKILSNAPAFVREFLKNSEKEGEGVHKVGGASPHLNTNTNTNPHSIFNIDINDFNAILAFFRETYYAATQKDHKKGKFLTIDKFQNEDLKNKWEQLPDKSEIVKAWKLYCDKLADDWGEYIDVKTFLNRYTKIQQKMA